MLKGIAISPRDLLPTQQLASHLTHYQMNYFFVEVTFSLKLFHIPSFVKLSAPKLHTSALTAIPCTFVTQTTPTH